MQLEPGMRIRCVDASPKLKRLTRGKEYWVISAGNEYAKVLDNLGDITDWFVERFKPIFRVKAPSRPGCCNKACNGCPDFAFRARLHRFATSGDGI